MSEVQRKHFLVSCKPCGHVWSLTPLPMPMMEVANLVKHARCPKCESGSDRHFMAGEAQAAAWAQQLEARG